MSEKIAGFPRAARLLTAAAYARVFERPRKSVDGNFTVLWRLNRVDRGRLGLAISKKCLKRAVDRNRVKRLVRESFRRHQSELAGIDLVVLGRRDLDPGQPQKINDSLESHWQRIRTRLAQAG